MRDLKVGGTTRFEGAGETKHRLLVAEAIQERRRGLSRAARIAGPVL